MAVSRSAPAKRTTSGQGSKGRPGGSQGSGGGKGAPRKSSASGGVPRVLWGVVALVVVAVLVIVLVAVVGGSPKSKPTTRGSGVNQVAVALSAVPQSVLTSFGTGVTSGPGAVTTLPVPITSSQPPLVSGGLPEVFYAGAEYCPFCAAERWAMVQALSRFGTFSGLGETHSSPTDVYRNTPTFTFFKSTYTSKYIDFVPVELADVAGKPLQKATKDQQDLINKYDGPPYISGNSGSIPFIDIGNKYIQSGAEFVPQVLQGMSFQNIAAAAQLPGTPAGQAIDSAANYLTAAICTITQNKPASVCNQPYIPEAIAKMSSAAKSSSSGNATPGAAG